MSDLIDRQSVLDRIDKKIEYWGDAAERGSFQVFVVTGLCIARNIVNDYPDDPDGKPRVIYRDR